jgi:hypothetical protein
MLGAALPLLVSAIWYWRRGGRASVRFLIVSPMAMLASGLWAVVPDMPRLWGDVQLYHRLHYKSWANIFWGHQWIDFTPAVDEWKGYPLVFMAFCGVILAAVLRELRMSERDLAST